MYALFIVLNEVEYLPDILYKIRQLGIRGATVIDSMGSRAIEEKSRYDIPLIGGFMKSLEEVHKVIKRFFGY